MWMFCVAACLAVVVIVKLAHLYSQHHQEEQPVQNTSIFEVLKQDNMNSGN